MNAEKKEEVKIYDEKPEATYAVVKLEAFDEVGVGLLKEMQDRNNEYAALRQQEEQTRLRMKQLREFIHKIKKMRDITKINVPFGSGFRQLELSEKDEFIKNHIEVYNNLDNQLQGIIGQRMHRLQAYGHSLERVMMYLWARLNSLGYKDEELIADHNLRNQPPPTMNRQPSEIKKLLDEAKEKI